VKVGDLVKHVGPDTGTVYYGIVTQAPDPRYGAPVGVLIIDTLFPIWFQPRTLEVINASR
jgi:hypothetical protein